MFRARAIIPAPMHLLPLDSYPARGQDIYAVDWFLRDMTLQLHKNQTPHNLNTYLSRFILQPYISLDMKRKYPIHRPRAENVVFARRNLSRAYKS